MSLEGRDIVGIFLFSSEWKNSLAKQFSANPMKNDLDIFC